ncbi:katanin p80 WD40 repeat-containing subunit B1 isoform X1 [Antennarius striatus]|uniref:katanin p80 WD40 repeat-containing subunit B1 isoform X1 n=1 Tax=Antennarius striatus TaxID=241820 RepID=UPI0035AFEB89
MATAGVRGPLQQRVVFGAGEKLRPPAGDGRGGLPGQPVGRQQAQLHHEFHWSQEPGGVCPVQRVGGSDHHRFTVWIHTGLGHGGGKDSEDSDGTQSQHHQPGFPSIQRLPGFKLHGHKHQAVGHPEERMRVQVHGSHSGREERRLQPRRALVGLGERRQDREAVGLEPGEDAHRVHVPHGVRQHRPVPPHRVPAGVRKLRQVTCSNEMLRPLSTDWLSHCRRLSRTVKLWDLEKFTKVGSMEGSTSPIRCICFSPDGDCLYSGAADSLRVLGWEPDCCFDVVPVGWGKVTDLATCNQQLIGVSHQLSTVSSYVVDLKRVKRSGSAVQGVVQDNQSLTEMKDPKGNALRRSYERPMTSCSAQGVKQRLDAERRSPEGERRSPSEDEADEKVSTAEIHNAEDYKEIFQPKKVICRTPPRIPEPFPAPPEDDAVVSISRQLKDLVSPFPDKQQGPPPLASSTPVQRVEPTVVSSVKQPASSNPAPAAPPPPLPPPVTTATCKPQPKIILSDRKEPIGLNVADFLPAPPNNRGRSLSDADALAQIKKGHETMCVMLSSRHRNLETVRGVWARDDIRSALDAADSMNDLSIVVDILNIINLHPLLWRLDLCTTIIPQTEKLLQSKYESYMQTGCTSLKLIMKHFWRLISDTLKAPPSVGVDITREERHQKCAACYKQLKNLSRLVRNKASQVGRHGSTFRELQLLMAPLDDSL